jgi:hypothetical protein
VRRVHWCATTLLLPTLLSFAPEAQAPGAADPFASFRPWVEITPADRARADRGETIVRILPADDQQVAILGVLALRTEPDAFVAHMRNIEALRTNPPRVPLTKRFSEPPVRGDLAPLVLEPEEAARIRRCEAGDCKVKLSAPEIARLRAAADAGADHDGLEQAFRDVLFDRVTSYLAGGLGSLPPYADKSPGVSTADATARVLGRLPFLTTRLPGLAAFVSQFPRASIGGGSGFLYWAVDRVEDRSIVSATHVAITRHPPASGLPAVVVAGKQIFATHYYHASLGLTCLVGEGPRYLVYINRTELDVLGGFFGPLKRAVLESRLKRDVAGLLAGLRTRLERPPPGAPDVAGRATSRRRR